jgi:hypothetical protein
MVEERRGDYAGHHCDLRRSDWDFAVVIAREKFCLDLYHRRFEIYGRTINFAESIFDWESVKPELRLLNG